MDKSSKEQAWERLGTFLTHQARPQPQAEGAYVNFCEGRGSTVLFPSFAAMQEQGKRRYTKANIYGAMGSPIQGELEEMLASLEGGAYAQLYCSGLAACTSPLFAFLKVGDHCLIADNIYGPTRRFASNMLRSFGVEISFFPSRASKEELAAYFRDNTAIIFTESPGSHSFEVQDIPMIADVAHRHNALVFMDNTWGFGIFSPFVHGVDVSIQALTKYPSGHSDLVGGAVIVNDEGLWKKLRDSAIMLGQLLDPQTCWLTLRGLRTLGVRLAYQARSALDIAKWLQNQDEIEAVLHPALPSCPGHDFWKRDFSGSGSLFGVRLRHDISFEKMIAMVDHLTLFGIGASWGGFESLILPSYPLTREVDQPTYSPIGFRLQIGLEKTQDLIEDLAYGLKRLA